jgi:uncharacterized protein
MELYAIPFHEQYIIYRPLRQLAFLGNSALVAFIQERVSDSPPPGAKGEAGEFLNAIGFWEPDPTPPPPWEPSGEHHPTMAVLLMTSACNLRCTYCYARGGEDPSLRMTFPLARAVIDAAHKNARILEQDHFSLSFHGGGEPTLNWEVLTAAVDHARSKDLPCHVSLATNGVWTDRQREYLLQNVNGLSLSFDGIREVQDAQRPLANGKGSFDAVRETIRALDAAKFPYGIRLTTTVDSSDRLPECIAFLCAETACPSLQVEPCYTSARGTYSDPTPEQADRFIHAVLQSYEITATAKRTFFYSGARPWVIAGSFCRAPEDALVVTPEGDVVTCFETHDRRHALTSYFTIGHASPEGVEVDSMKVRAFADQQRERRAECEGCFCYWHCGGDCASRCMASPAPDRVRCRVNRALTRELLAWYIAFGEGVWQGGNGIEPAREHGC